MDSAADSFDMEQGGSKQRRKSCAGRKLMRWDPSVDQLVLLTVEKVCIEYGILIPWDTVASEVRNNLTAEALKQHLVKLRAFREKEGQKVPEKIERGARRKVSIANQTSTDASFEKVDQVVAAGEQTHKTESCQDLSRNKDNAPKPSALLFHRPGKKTAKKEGDSLNNTVASTTRKTSTKRPRQPKKKSIVDDSDSEAEAPPVKKQRDYSFRAVPLVDYSEQAIDPIPKEEGEEEDERSGNEPRKFGRAIFKVESDSELPTIGGQRNDSVFELPQMTNGPIQESPATVSSTLNIDQHIEPGYSYGNGSNAYHGDASGITLPSPIFGFEDDYTFPWMQNNNLSGVSVGTGSNSSGILGFQAVSGHNQPLNINTFSSVQNPTSDDALPVSLSVPSTAYHAFDNAHGGLGESDMSLSTNNFSIAPKSPGDEVNDHYIFDTPLIHQISSLSAPRDDTFQDLIHGVTNGINYANGFLPNILDAYSPGLCHNFTAGQIGSTAGYGDVDTNGTVNYDVAPGNNHGLGFDFDGEW